jgi:uncharacterized membrane protein
VDAFPDTNGDAMWAILRQKAPLILLVVWCVALLEVRIWYTGNTINSFLLWNMALALVPLVAAIALRLAHLREGLGALKAAVFGVWLAFLPNAPYLTTDFMHLYRYQPVPMWYDIAMFGSFAATGVLIGYAAVADIETILAERFGRVAGSTIAFGSLLLCGFGIYLGRILRWNSWDIVTSPWTLGRQIAHQLANPLSHTATWEVSAIYGVGLVLGYVAIRSVTSTFRGRERVAAR